MQIAENKMEKSQDSIAEAERKLNSAGIPCSRVKTIEIEELYQEDVLYEAQEVKDLSKDLESFKSEGERKR